MGNYKELAEQVLRLGINEDSILGGFTAMDQTFAFLNEVKRFMASKGWKERYSMHLRDKDVFHVCYMKENTDKDYVAISYYYGSSVHGHVLVYKMECNGQMIIEKKMADNILRNDYNQKSVKAFYDKALSQLKAKVK